MKNTLILLCLSFAILTNSRIFGQVPALPDQFGPHQWTATVQVVGEDGNPIIGANVSVQYTVPTSPNSGDQDYGEVKGMTDTNGMFRALHTDSSWSLGVVVEKAGYYHTQMGHEFYFDDKRRNPSFTLLLKKIGKPIAMYAKSVNLGMPVFDKPAGFDLMVGDWVAPYGKGITTDIIFTAHKEKRSEYDWDYNLVVSFPNPSDGIQEFSVPEIEKGSALRSLHEAPTNNYQSQWVQTKAARPHPGGYSGNWDQNRNYYFRVRTKVDDRGNIVSANYGKIYGDFMQFSYYLNPTLNDRNIEFDPKQNLLGGLQSFEQVRQP